MKNQTKIIINKSIKIKSSNFKDIFETFKILMITVFEDFVKEILLESAEKYFKK